MTVPAGSPAVTFESLWNTEAGWDFGFVQVSTDAGRTYQSSSCTDTTSVTDPGGVATIDRVRLSENLTWICGSGRRNEDADDDDGGEGGDCLSRLRATANDVVAAIVTFEDPTESITDYAPYELIVNGVTQPGGS